MRVLLADPRGFCAGVNMAIECVERLLALKGPPIHVYHEIVHNRHVVYRFESRGVVFVNRIQDVPDGAIVVYSAHGVSPELRRQARSRGLTEVDATCPLVAKVHAEAVRYARQAYSIVLIGHAEHDEVVGTLGEAPDVIHLVERVEDVAALDIPPEHRVAYLTQTTLSLDDAAAIITALKARYPRIQAPGHEDICYATTNRQGAVMRLSSECDLVLVVGSRNSSNSKRLVEIAGNRGVRGHLIDDAAELRDEWFTGIQTVLLTAGASAPEDLVQGVLQVLTHRHGATVETRQFTTEEMFFEQPASLRTLESLPLR